MSSPNPRYGHNPGARYVTDNIGLLNGLIMPGVNLNDLTLEDYEILSDLVLDALKANIKDRYDQDPQETAQGLITKLMDERDTLASLQAKLVHLKEQNLFTRLKKSYDYLKLKIDTWGRAYVYVKINKDTSYEKGVHDGLVIAVKQIRDLFQSSIPKPPEQMIYKNIKGMPGVTVVDRPGRPPIGHNGSPNSIQAAVKLFRDTQ